MSVRLFCCLAAQLLKHSELYLLLEKAYTKAALTVWIVKAAFRLQVLAQVSKLSLRLFDE